MTTDRNLKIVTYDTLIDFIAEQAPHSLYRYEGEWLKEALSVARPGALL